MNAELRWLLRGVTLLILGAAGIHAATTSDLTFVPTTMAFKYTIGGALPAAQTLQIKSTGTALAFTIPVPAAPWLSLSAYSGTTPASIKVYVNPTSLPSGVTPASLTINCPNAVTTTQAYSVTLDISDPTPILASNTNTLSFAYATDQANFPAAQNIVLSSTGSAISAGIAVTGATWLSAQFSGAISIVGIPSSVSVSVNPTGLVPGTYTGSIKFTPTNTAIAAVTVAVTLSVSAGVPVVTGLWPPGALVNSPNMIVTVTGSNFFSTSVASVGAVKLAAPNLISSNAMMVTIPATLMTAAGNLPITITTPTAASASATTLASTFKVYLPGPQVLAVTDGASYAAGTISPGEIITIYGLGLGPANLSVLTVQDPLATVLPPSSAAQTSVTIGGAPAPLLYVGANAIGCIVPFSVAASTGSTVNLSVTYNSIAVVSPTKVNVATATPGLFTADASGAGQGAILNYNPTSGDYSVNSLTNPAIKGATVAVLYMTGFGVTNCTNIPASGLIPASNCNPSATELNLISGAVTPSLPVAVTIGGQPAPGAVAQAPLGGVPGLMQVNVPVPAGVTPGAVPVTVTLGSGASQFTTQANVTMTVK